MNARTPTAVVVGEALADIIVTDGVERSVPGGSPLNVAVGLARLGVQTQLLAELGDDAAGDLVRAHLAASDVGVDLVARVASTSTARAKIRADGSAEYDFRINWTLDDEVTAPASDLLHTGSIGSWLHPGADRVREIIRSRGPDTLASFDPNIRPSLISDRASAVTQIEALARESDVVKLSDEDAAWLYPGQSATRVGDHFLSLGVSLVAITFGAEGSIVRSAGQTVEQPAAPVRVVDTIGAGDAYMSGLLFALAAGDLLGSVRDGLDRDALHWAAAIAAESACVAVGREGADPPRRGELSASMRRSQQA